MEVDVVRVVALARAVCAAAHVEGWLTSPVAASSALQRAVRQLADVLNTSDGQHGVPTIDDLLSFASTIDDDGYRASALADLVPYVDEAQRSRLLAAGHAIHDEYQRCRVFAAVALRASAPQLADILAAVHGFEFSRNRMFGLRVLLPYVAGADRNVVINAAVDAIEENGEFYFASATLEQLAPHLTPAQIDRALAAVGRSVTSETDQSNLLTGFASLRPHAWWGEAVAAAAAIEQQNLRAVTLIGLAQQAPAEHLDAVLAAAHAIGDASTRARALAGVIPHLHEHQRAAAIDAAIDILLTAPVDDSLRGIALSMLLPLLDQDQIAAILDHDARGPRSTGWSLVLAAPYAGPQHLATALAATIAPDRLGDPLTNVPMTLRYEFGKLLEHLPVDQQNAGAVSAISLRGQLGDFAWSDRLRGLAAYLTPPQLDQLLTSMDALEASAAGTAIANLAAHLTPGQLDTALTMIPAIDIEYSRGIALAGIAPFLTDDAHLERLVAAVLDLHDPETLVDTVTAVLPHTSAAQQALLAQTALHAATAIDDPDSRAGALLTLAAADPSRRDAALARAFAAMTTMTDANAQVRMLNRIVPLATAAPQPH
ncbi:hypothetical protein KZZ52_22980 [Dactylosporangium sp. AC04546]|uniref:hypothetical protein n=1 Tax=Dactylosporangium sp. AC04546 TaxID=2862460 RepID=UPI001EDE5898|nr:hypothetical protein [Dactylosporangium sp. AC04546]WVK88143.1 hypothetical protein KZZ52_22980 [Dactylosporangium sp. AC04546]